MRPATDIASSLPGAQRPATPEAAMPRSLRPYLVAPVILPLLALPAPRALGALGVAPLASWHGAARHALALMFVFTGVAYFTGKRASLPRMVPGRVPFPGLAVAATGLLRFLGATGLLLPALAPLAGRCLSLLLMALFPANVHAARARVDLDGKPAAPVWYPAPVQLPFIGLLLWPTW